MRPTQPDIRAATSDDLPSLYALLRDALMLDNFSADLLDEKLFGHRPEGMQAGAVVAESDGRVVAVMQHVLQAPQNAAWVGLFAVAEPHRRRGIATQLFHHVRTLWPAELEQIEVLAIPGNYLLPGIDPRYTAGLSFAESLGFERFKDCVNLIAPLDRVFETAAEEQRLAAQGVQVRRAAARDGAMLDAYFGQHFGAGWRYEAEMALASDPPALHIAIRDERFIGFSAHSTQNREWGFFGPMGTAPESRGLGIGRVLLWHCLNDLRATGHRTSVIPWVGPISFYSQWCGAVVERVFWRYRLNPSRLPRL
jgi:GNAT superfamily N-acetyltransferase